MLEFSRALGAAVAAHEAPWDAAAIRDYIDTIGNEPYAEVSQGDGNTSETSEAIETRIESVSTALLNAETHFSGDAEASITVSETVSGTPLSWTDRLPRAAEIMARQRVWWCSSAVLGIAAILFFLGIVRVTDTLVAIAIAVAVLSAVFWLLAFSTAATNAAAR